MFRSIFVTTILFLAGINCSSLNVDNCGKVDVEVVIPSCQGTPCKIKRGSDHDMEIWFRSPIDSNKMNVDVRAVFGPFQLPWPGFDRNGCNGFGVECPIRRNQEVVYKRKLEVKSAYPRISTEVLFKSTGDNRKEVFCFRFPIEVV